MGTYLESETEVKNFQLTKGQIVILSAGIVRAEVIAEGWGERSEFRVRQYTLLGSDDLEAPAEWSREEVYVDSADFAAAEAEHAHDVCLLSLEVARLDTWRATAQAGGKEPGP